MPNFSNVLKYSLKYNVNFDEWCLSFSCDFVFVIFFLTKVNIPPCSFSLLFSLYFGSFGFSINIGSEDKDSKKAMIARCSSLVSPNLLINGEVIGNRVSCLYSSLRKGVFIPALYIPMTLSILGKMPW